MYCRLNEMAVVIIIHSPVRHRIHNIVIFIILATGQDQYCLQAQKLLSLLKVPKAPIFKLV